MSLRVRDGVAGYAGLQSCGSVWADPVCNAKIMARRRLEIGAAVGLWQAKGGRVAFLTFTMRHDRTQGLGELWDALGRAWSKVTAGRVWVLAQKRVGLVGWLRLVEVTVGRNGWHVHVHALAFLAPTTTKAQLKELHASMFGRWERQLVRDGLAAPLAVGQDARLIDGPADEDLAAYFTKATSSPQRISLELTAGQTKKARTAHSTRPAWNLLEDVINTGDAHSLDLWHEYERYSKGRRQIAWSKGLRELLELGIERADETIAAEELGTVDDTLLLIDKGGWDVLCEAPVRLAILLSVAEESGLQGVRSYLDRLGASYSLPCEVMAA